jgi:Rps23 Pro-64 3,4-dihydroxylase Tpa1-like proline 4-hydroxylase
MISSQAIERLNEGFKEMYPFQHIVIDNFLKEEYLERILGEVNVLSPENAYYKITEKNDLEYNKFAFNTDVGPTVSALFRELVSESFIASIERLTNIKDILPNDLSLKGAGVHKIKRDGYLAVHTDFNTYSHPYYGKLDRRINILIYLNPSWKESYKGHLWLCNSSEPVKKILPILNRCVIFTTTSNSFHGHPERLLAPEGTFRTSIACYYYTKNTNEPYDFEGRPQDEHAKMYSQFKYDIIDDEVKDEGEA